MFALSVVRKNMIHKVAPDPFLSKPNLFLQIATTRFDSALFNRLLYIDFDALQDTVIKHVHSVTWKNGMTVPMVVDIKYMRNSIYNISGDIYCTIQPGEIYEMPEFFYYEQKRAVSICAMGIQFLV